MPHASARHILVEDKKECEEIKEQITAGGDFAALALEHSLCPSGQEGGALGEFEPGQMVPEFDRVVFSAPIGVVQGPVRTQFGWHLVEVTDRSE
jgi:peptidyl-prolyl cis-trans isomerase C